jgi:uncharacterized SAM-binding protein YcdF (DUF218 family)
MKTEMSRRRESLLRLLIASLAIGMLLSLAIAFVYRSTVFGWAKEYLEAADASAVGDVGFILGGGRSTRVDYAAELFQAGRIHHLLVSRSAGLADVDGVKLLPDDQIVVGMLRALDVPAEAIEVVDEDCPNTKAEAKVLAKYLQRHPQATAVVISSAYHLRRCRLLFGRSLGKDIERVRFAAPAEIISSGDGTAKYRSYALELTKIPSAWVESIWPW